MLFAGFAVLVTGLLAWLSFRAVSGALQDEFESRLSGIAGTAASQVSAADIADAELFGEDGAGYGNLQVLMAGVRATTGIANASVIDTAGTVVYDASSPELQHQPTPLTATLGRRLALVLHGGTTLTELPRGKQRPAIAVAPVLSDTGTVAGAVAIEARVDYLPALGDFRRSLALITVVILVAMGVLAALVVRTAWSSAQLERRLSRAENLAAMGRLTATLAHEIKNPLAIIRGSASRLGKLEPEANRMAEFVIEETDRLNRTVARYLKFARGGDESLEQGGDAAAALEATLDLLEGELEARRVTAELGPRALDPAPVRLDEESLKQVYLNLILNAVEAMPAGGHITIAREDRGGDVRVTIEDHGPGMSREVLDKLGSPFFSTKAQGSGLGLFLTRRLVRSAGGALEITSTEGRGTRCIVRLPRRKA